MGMGRMLQWDEMDDAALEDAYAYPAESSDQTWVRVNFVSTLDGAAQGGDDLSGSLSSEADKRVFALLRSLADVVLVGSGTAAAEKYAPVKPSEIDVVLRARLGLAPSLPIAVVSKSLHVPEALLAPGQLVITTATAPAERLAALRKQIDVIAVGEDAIDWPAALRALGERGLQRISCEGGPSLHGALAAEDLVDELCLTLSPLVVAGESARITDATSSVEHRMSLAHAIQADDMLLTRYTRIRV
ncbi:pyrimidine reductase family protein [soil metagenome]